MKQDILSFIIENYFLTVNQDYWLQIAVECKKGLSRIYILILTVHIINKYISSFTLFPQNYDLLGQLLASYWSICKIRIQHG